MRCGNSHCEKRKISGFIGRVLDRDGFIRENIWYCSQECFASVIMDEYFHRKRSNTEIRRSTFPVTSRAFGSALISMGKIKGFQLDEALVEKSRNGRKPLAHYLMKKGLINRKDVLEAIGKIHKVPIASLHGKRISRDIIEMIPEEIVRTSCVIPFDINRKEGALYLLMKDVSDLTTIFAIKRLTGLEVRCFLGDPEEISRSIENCYRNEAVNVPEMLIPKQEFQSTESYIG